MNANTAQYQAETQIVTGLNGTGLPTHYVMTRHGAVSRTFLPGSLLVNVALWRPGNKHPQFQGSIRRAANGQFEAINSKGQHVAFADDYLDAEAALLPLRMRTRSHSGRQWPETILRELEWSRVPLSSLAGKVWCPPCHVCGHEMPGGVCVRPDLHWELVGA